MNSKNNQPEPNSNDPVKAKLTKIEMAARLARSGIRRYPNELASSLRGHSVEILPLSLPSLDTGALGAVWLGHASVLVQIGGRWILTDPVFSSRIGVSVGSLTFGVARRAPLIDAGTLPPIDIILLSHAHFDHLDRPTLSRLIHPKTTVITARHTKSLIPQGFGRVVELDWGNHVEVDGIEFEALATAHWGARTIWDRHRGYNAYLMRDRRHRVLFAGDTALTTQFEGVGGADLTLFGIGAYDPWITKHASPEQVWQMHQASRGAFLLPIHHSTFKLSEEPFAEPMDRLLTAAGPLADRVVGRDLGQMWVLPTAAPGPTSVPGPTTEAGSG